MSGLEFELQPMEKEEFRKLSYEKFKNEYPNAVDKVADR